MADSANLRQVLKAAKPYGWTPKLSRLLLRQLKAAVEVLGLTPELNELAPKIGAYLAKAEDPSIVFEILREGRAATLSAPLRQRLKELVEPHLNEKLKALYSDEKIEHCEGKVYERLQKKETTEALLKLLEAGCRSLTTDKFLRQKIRETLEEKMLSLTGENSADARPGVIPLYAITNMEPLAAGGFSKVYSGIYNGQKVAVKIATQGGAALSPASDAVAADEWASLQALTASEHVVEVKGGYKSESVYLIVMELLRESLREYLGGDGDIPWSTRCRLAFEVASGIHYLHVNRFVHCDLKSENIMLNDSNTCKITDFGLALNKQYSVLSHMPGKQQIATTHYAAPELFVSGNAYSTKSEVYAFAMILWEIAARKPPYEDADADVICGWVKAGTREKIPSDTPPDFAELITKCWHQDKDKRPPLTEIIPVLEEMASAHRILEGAHA